MVWAHACLFLKRQTNIGTFPLFLIVSLAYKTPLQQANSLDTDMSSATKAILLGHSCEHHLWLLNSPISWASVHHLHGRRSNTLDASLAHGSIVFTRPESTPWVVFTPPSHNSGQIQEFALRMPRPKDSSPHRVYVWQAPSVSQSKIFFNTVLVSFSSQWQNAQPRQVKGKRLSFGLTISDAWVGSGFPDITAFRWMWVLGGT